MYFKQRVLIKDEIAVTLITFNLLILDGQRADKKIGYTQIIYEIIQNSSLYKMKY